MQNEQLVEACHALGARYQRRDGATAKVGSCADSDITVFSFHPVKTVAAGEGGAALTNDPSLAQRLAMFRNHGVNRDAAQFTDKEAGFESAPENPQVNPWYYEMTALGLNYRLSDINCALAKSQLGKLEIGQFHDVERFSEILGMIHDKRGVPVDHDQIVFIITQIASGGFVRFLIGEMVNVWFLGKQRGNFAAITPQPILSTR